MTIKIGNIGNDFVKGSRIFENILNVSLSVMFL